MNRFPLLALCLMAVVSCSTTNIYTKMVYAGQAKYYLPNGETEVYDATYTETFFNGIKNSEDLNVDVGAGNVFIFHGIPYTFKGHITSDSGSIKIDEDYSVLNPNEKDGMYEFFYNGVNYEIPANVYNEAKYKSNGNADRLNKLLIEYIKKQ